MNKSTQDTRSYSEKLQDPRWQKKRLEIFERDNWACQICGIDEETLHVHHRKYISGRNPWEYHNDLLTTLCKDCHESETELLPECLDLMIESTQYMGFFSAELDALRDVILSSNKLPIPPIVALERIVRVLTTPELAVEFMEIAFRKK